MMTKNDQILRLSALLAAVVTSLTVAALPSPSHADAWELKTVAREVPGTRLIKSGKPEKAVRTTELYLPLIRPKVAGLTNLCIGYLLLKDYAQAEHYCDEAVARKSKPSERAVTHNNRGVFRALQGDYEGAGEDFAIAACENECDLTSHTQRDLRPVARRNLERAEVRLLASEKQDNAVARADQ